MGTFSCYDYLTKFIGLSEVFKRVQALFWLKRVTKAWQLLAKRLLEARPKPVGDAARIGGKQRVPYWKTLVPVLVPVVGRLKCMMKCIKCRDRHIALNEAIR